LPITVPYYERDPFDAAMLPDTAAWAAKIIKEVNADAIVACGHSGLVMAGAVGFATGVPIVAVRKPGEAQLSQSHETVNAALPAKAQRWVWIDDFVASGHTYRHAREELIRREIVESPEPEALILYAAYKDGNDYTRRQLNTTAAVFGRKIA
jgi:phosphoribosylpyrophosphate synthetase